ncbi:nudC domain-containing protein 3 [Lucilia cuprina]|uniref:nudC domain-containing protein 3 n=1 Tax=Lucilia cuprina TaxID=7375 RepID=UPI001F056387|nr:nudC domain-containing protein 3 [Lucilia cuprina]
MEHARSDCILREILEERKSLTGFLDAVFGFMSRNTDFFHIQKTKDDKIGFPRGDKEQILMSCMQKYEHKMEEPKLTRDLIVDVPQVVAEEVEIMSEEINDGNLNNMDPAVDAIKQNDIEMLETKNKNEISANTIKFNEDDYKNGSLFENYCWSQTLKDVELQVLLPKEVKIAKHVKVLLKTNRMTVKTLLPKEETLIDAETWDKYRHNDVLWSITDGKLVINFDKLKECWWDKLFLSDISAIDIKAVDTERPLNDYSPDTQNEIEKLHLQQQSQQTQDLKTLPLSESEQMARLRQAWNAEGSPFKGQPFDPSVVKFN